MKVRSTLFVLVFAGMLCASDIAVAQNNTKSTCCDLKSAMRKLWEDHIIWTRNVIFNIIDDLPGTDQAVARLLQNQDDIGNAIKPFYGEAAGNQLATLLREHITIAAEILVALKTNNTAAFNDANARWIANADAIARFLSTANPKNWPFAEMQAMMYDHLNLTASEALARKNADYAADVIAFDRIHMQILEMADMLTEGIINQFPNMFKGCGRNGNNGNQNGQGNNSQSAAILNQNAPNPFVDRTVISFFIPDEVKQAQLVIYDDMGNKVKTFDIETKGEGNLTFQANNLRKGVYMYSLLVDGRLVDTKTMVR